MYWLDGVTGGSEYRKANIFAELSYQFFKFNFSKINVWQSTSLWWARSPPLKRSIFVEINFCEISFPRGFFFCERKCYYILHRFIFGLVWKMVNTWRKRFLCDPLSKTGVFDFLISWIFRKKTKTINQIKVYFWSILAVFVPPSMLI